MGGYEWAAIRVTKLLTAYRNAVGVFKDAVEKASKANKADFPLTANQAVRLLAECKDANDAFMEHWLAEHRSLVAQVGS